jgi:hypothetical protein
LREELSFLLVAAVCTAAAAAQAWFFPFGHEKAEPRTRRTIMAAVSLLVMLGSILVAHLLLPGRPTLASAGGAVVGVLLMKAIRSGAGSAPPAR